MAAHRIALQRLLHHQRQAGKTSPHVRIACRKPDLHTADSDEAAPLFRDDCAPGFRDDLAPCLVGSAG
ncbi:hypothetical protein CN092_36115, partial [Sinorhizobium meliloti]